MTTFVLATANAHKAIEMRAVLGELGIDVVGRPDDVDDVEETATTLEGNALLKALTIAAATGRAAIADDTGLFVDALEGRPGVRSARYAGEGAGDDENITKLLGELDHVEGTARAAHFRTVIAVAYPSGESWWVEGVLEGRITWQRRGGHGFGYDAVFEPRHSPGRTLGEMTLSEKNATSHRAAALRALAAALTASSRDAPTRSLEG